MSDDTTNDVHAPYVRELAGDWAALALYGRVHHYPEAFDRAIELSGENPPLARFLTAMRDDPFADGLASPEELLPQLTRPQTLTLFLLLLVPRVEWCELAKTSNPPEDRERLYRRGLAHGEEASRFAAELGDRAAYAYCQALMASGLFDLGEWEAAREHGLEGCGYYGELLEVRPEIYGFYFASASQTLGAIWASLGESQAALECFRRALKCHRELARADREVLLPYLAPALDGIVKVLAREIDPSVLDICGEALEVYRDLAKLDPDAYAAGLARLLQTRGEGRTVFGHLEAAEADLLEALALYRELARSRPDAHDADVASVLGSLAATKEALGEFAEAFPLLKEAMAILHGLYRSQPEPHRVALAAVFVGLGNLFERAERLGEARDFRVTTLALYRESPAHTPQAYSGRVALALHDLGLTQRLLGETTDARASFEEAIALRRELARHSPSTGERDLAGSLLGLGAFLGDLGELTPAFAHLREACELYEAEAVRRPTAQLVTRRIAWENLGDLYSRESAALGLPDRHQARSAFRKARDCAEAYRRRFRDVTLRGNAQLHALYSYEALVLVNVDLWQFDGDRLALHEAVEVAEQSRARNLLEMLDEEALVPVNAPEQLVVEFRELHRRLHFARRKFESATNSSAVAGDSGDSAAFVPGVKGPPTPPVPLPDPVAKIEQTFAEVQRLHDESLTRIRTHDPDFDPRRPVAPVSFAQAAALLPTDVPTAFVQFCLTDDRGFAFVLTPTDAFAVPLPELNARQGWDLADAWYRSYYGGDRHAWEAALPELIRPVSERAIRPVVAALANLGVRRLILTPHKGLHVFPLHACTLADGRLLFDAFDEVGYAPSLSILHRCAARPRPTPTDVVLVENPTGDLPFTKVECAGLRSLYRRAATRRGPDAVRERLLKDAPSTHVFHYSGHARFDPDDPLKAALALHGDPLTLRDVFGNLHLRSASLAVLNGCESGMVKAEATDEYFGLSAGFLFSGAACVVSTLWAVWDLSSALLSLRFHRNWAGGATPPLTALTEAQRWLRGLTGDAVLQEAARLFDLAENDEQRGLCIQAMETYKEPDATPFASPVHWAPSPPPACAIASSEGRRGKMDAVARPCHPGERSERRPTMSILQTLGPAFGPTFDEDDRYEVVNGQRVELPPMSARETDVANQLLLLLGPQISGQGRPRTEMLFLIDSDSDLQRRPDLAFVSFARWPRGRPVPTTNAWAVVPDLAAEVVSPTNGFNEILTKLHDYFRCGVRLVWVVLPLFEQVYVYTSPTSVRILTRDDALDGGEVMQSLRVPLAEVFERPDEVD